MPDVLVDEVVLDNTPQESKPITLTTLQWAELRDLMREVDAKLFKASMIARLEMKNTDMHQELYKHRVDMQYTNMKIGNALKRDRPGSPYYMSVSDIEKELQNNS